MRTRLILGLTASAALGLACTSQINQGPADPDRFGEFSEVIDRTDDAPVVDEAPPSEVAPPVIDEPTPTQGLPSVIDGNITATFTSGLSVRGDATSLTTWVDYGFTEIDILRDEAGGAAMGMIFIGGDLNGPVFNQVGAVTRIENGVMTAGPEGAEDAWVDLTACAGPDSYVWDIDEPAETVVIEVSQGPEPDDRVVTLTALIGPNGSTGRVQTQMLLTR